MPRLSRFCLALGLWLAVALSGHAAEPTENPGKGRPIHFGPNDWPWWRGPTRDGVAPAGDAPPVTWSETENILWKVDVPGRGHGSPTVFGDQVFLAAAEPDREVQSVLCFDRRTGKRLWQSVVHEKGFTTKGNAKSSLASSSVACDGERLYVSFLNREAVYLTCLDLQGAMLWQTKITDFALHQGYAASPALYESVVMISADSKSNGLFAGVDRANGQIVWKHERPKLPNYTSPIVLSVAGRDQVFLTGCNLVSSFDPKSGKKLWEIAGATEECVTSTVTDGKVIFSSGGYPKDHLAAIAADGSGKVVWENKSRVYVPSMIVRDGYLYGTLDAGVAMCWRCSDGAEMWKQRLGGTFSASLVLAGDALYACNEEGQTFVFKATPKGFESLGENRLGISVFASPVICGGRIYHRVAHDVDGQRREVLYCIGK
ncbi:MAG: PQQ-binding-like beta-propeller repeat protein [Planctomycetota bacterium]|nr:PQQ-binding-like beta-propeller repeat protein [Planctomycetota bacterium]